MSMPFELSSMNDCTKSLASNNIALWVKTVRMPHLHIAVVPLGEKFFTLESNQLLVISEYAFCTVFLCTLEL